MSQPLSIKVLDLEVDGRVIFFVHPGGSSLLAVDEAQSLIDQLGDAIDAARSHVAHDPFHKDETNEIEDFR